MITDKDQQTWSQVTSNYYAYILSLQKFFAEDVDYISILKNALRKPGERKPALSMLQYLKPENLKQLFNELVFLASFDEASIGLVRSKIMELPREWVLEHIEEAAEPYLTNAEDFEFRRLLELYIDLDKGLAKKLAQRASESTDYDTREAGEDFLNIIGEDK